LWDLFLLAVLIAAAFGARIFALFVLLPPLERLGFVQSIDSKYKLAIIWGGLRGALTLVLALAVTENETLPRETQRFVAVLAAGLVLFTLFVNGTTLRLVIRLLGLDRLSARDEVAPRPHSGIVLCRGAGRCGGDCTHARAFASRSRARDRALRS
jgi:CPA1 family monovalent cation:H+ antiporter